eukprot:TRINITY_DN23180_c0_g1_i1.p1 TRINITY_DN23180_c0_g1~~TRINITY_DN23180_c0_g1_i1.p1  ORF type:complete len:480 (+),score=87.63 TRINITY_DN23180_c0_g1_i1:50-1489(+)
MEVENEGCLPQVRQSRSYLINQQTHKVVLVQDSDSESEWAEDEKGLFEGKEEYDSAAGEDDDDDDDVLVLQPDSQGVKRVPGTDESRKRKWIVLSDNGEVDCNVPPEAPASVFTQSLKAFFGCTLPTSAFILEWLEAVTRHASNTILAKWLSSNLTPDEGCYVTEHQIVQELIRDPRMRLNPNKKKTLSTWLVKVFPQVLPTVKRTQNCHLPLDLWQCRGPSEGCLRLQEITNRYKPLIRHQSHIIFTGVRWVAGDVIPPIADPPRTLGVWSHEVVFKHYERDPLPPYICNGRYVLKTGPELIREKGPAWLIKMLIELDDEVYKGLEGEMDKEEFEEWLMKDLILVVERKQGIDSLAAAVVQEWRSASTDDVEPLCFVHWLGVAPQFRRHGIARALMELHTSTCATLLEVHRSNVGAIGLYSKYGMVPIGASREDKAAPWNYMFRRRAHDRQTTNNSDNVLVSPSKEDVSKLYSGVFDE